MLIKRASQLSGVTREIEIPITQDQLDQWQSGALIQDAMPNLTPDQREFILSGIIPEEWEEAFGGEGEGEKEFKRDSLRELATNLEVAPQDIQNLLVKVKQGIDQYGTKREALNFTVQELFIILGLIEYHL